MKELTEYRINLIDRLVAAAHEFRDECLAARDADVPPAPGEWNIHQIASHTRDVDQLVYGLRVRRTAVEENPEFQNFDGESYMAQHYSADEPLNEILTGFVEHVESLANILHSLPVETWSRLSSHAMVGRGLTLQSWVEKDLAHIEEHLHTVRKQNKSRQ